MQLYYILIIVNKLILCLNLKTPRQVLYLKMIILYVRGKNDSLIANE
jgi:hypothetical protein